ncbi:MAG: signal peptidase I [Desulfovibrionaceae bacterium]|nr:signal peptidase I [Desulfovibrionaceae bacterium]
MNPKTSDTTQRNIGGIIKEYSEALGIALILALFIRTFVVQAFKIPSESMLNTLLVGDHLLGNKFIYGIKIPFTHHYIYRGEDPKRGDIIIFEYPEDESIDFIKRVVGIPGDVIEIRDKQFYRNGEPVMESYIRHVDPNISAPRDNFGPKTVPEGHYFVMGDNRDNSQDSRFWGFVKREAIVAKAWRIYFSWGPGGVSNIRTDRIGKEIL